MQKLAQIHSYLKHSRTMKNVSIVLLGLFIGSMLAQFTVFSPSTSQTLNGSEFNTPIASDSTFLSGGTSINQIKENSINDMGNVSITNINVKGTPIYLLSYNVFDVYPEYVSLDFIDTVVPATIDRITETNVDENSYYSSYVTILVNETINWQYTENSTEFNIGIYPYLEPSAYKYVYLNQTQLPRANYTYSYNDVEGFWFNYEGIFNETTESGGTEGNFDITYEYETEIPITRWLVSAPDAEIKAITELEQEFEQDFRYEVEFGKSDFSKDIEAEFSVTMPNPNDIYDLELISFENKTEDDLLTYQYNKVNNVVTVYANFSQNTQLIMDFTANFTVQILDAVNGFWCDDRLVENVLIRERSYKITITDGPADLFLKNIWLNETTIYYENIVSSNIKQSALNRPFQINNLNDSTGNVPTTLPEFTEDTVDTNVYYDGIQILGESTSNYYYLALDEVDLITVRYIASKSLSFVIMDEINTPLSNYDVKIYYFDRPYGTVISQYTSIPHPVKTTDRNGQVSIRNVPIGNFTLEIFDPNGNFVANRTVSSLSPINFVVTEESHFPTTILILGGISVAFILIGLIIYKKNQ